MLKKLVAPFRGETNQRYTKQLFWDQQINLPIEDRLIEPVFTLYLDRPGLINLGREYVGDLDMSGYKTSTRLFKDFGYWAHLMKAGWFREAVRQWDEEIEAKLYSEGLAKIRELANSDEKGAFTAAKYLADKSFLLDKKRLVKRGRPSNEEVEGRLNQMADEEKQLSEAADRIRLVNTN